MVQVFQLIATDENNINFEDALVNGDFHAAISYPELRTICGVQLDGDDGVGSGPYVSGPVTCRICWGIIEEIKRIRKWR